MQVTTPISSCAISDKLSELDMLFKNSKVNEDFFPEVAFDHLRSLGLLPINIPKRYGGLGIGVEHNSVMLLQVLRRIGFHDLSVGRIFEGHINAIQLIADYGNEEQKQKLFADCRNGLLFGTWNSELPDEAVQLIRTDSTHVLKGAKIFCSGGAHIHRPIVTAQGPQGKLMIILDLDHQNIEEDYTYWRPIGMKASVSCRLDFSSIKVDKCQILGRAGDYEREPDFSGGAVRFAAVQLGGAEAAIDQTLRHLANLNRLENSHQVRRMGKLSILKERGRAWLEKAGQASDNKRTAPDKFENCANMFRSETRHLCEEVLRLCELSVGLQGLMAPHPLERNSPRPVGLSETARTRSCD